MFLRGGWLTLGAASCASTIASACAMVVGTGAMRLAGFSGPLTPRAALVGSLVTSTSGQLFHRDGWDC
jgi:hypothetical protein